MGTPLLPPPFDQLGHRPFSFYPAIVNIEHNEWLLRKATWSEFLVANTGNTEEIWIPRRFLGEVSRTDDPVMIVGLTKELEFTAGQVIPHVRRVIEMPRAVNDIPRPPAPEPSAKSASVVGIRLETGAERRIGRLILWALGGGVIACVLLVTFFRADREGRFQYKTVMQSELGLSGSDDYFAVIRKLGQPEGDAWRSNQGEMQFRVLRYPGLGLSVILMGTERGKELYIGAVDANWRPVHTVRLPDGKSTDSLLRSIRRF